MQAPARGPGSEQPERPERLGDGHALGERLAHARLAGRLRPPPLRMASAATAVGSTTTPSWSPSTRSPDWRSSHHIRSARRRRPRGCGRARRRSRCRARTSRSPSRSARACRAHRRRRRRRVRRAGSSAVASSSPQKAASQSRGHEDVARLKRVDGFDRAAMPGCRCGRPGRRRRRRSAPSPPTPAQAHAGGQGTETGGAITCARCPSRSRQSETTAGWSAARRSISARSWATRGEAYSLSSGGHEAERVRLGCEHAALGVLLELLAGVGDVQVRIVSWPMRSSGPNAAPSLRSMLSAPGGRSGSGRSCPGSSSRRRGAARSRPRR